MRTSCLLTVVGVALIFAGTYAWVNRYTFTRLNSGAGGYILDSWTGEVCVVDMVKFYACFKLSTKKFQGSEN